MDFVLIYGVVGEHCNLGWMVSVRVPGLITKENVGISNDNAGEKPAHRKTKDSSAMLISWGLVGA